MQYCTKHEPWQQLRQQMRGKPTNIKLGLLWEWFELNETYNPMATRVQVWHYLAGLRRCGQLDENNRVVK
jgi:hypothetical protein